MLSVHCFIILVLLLENVFNYFFNALGPGGHRKILENGNLIISPVSRDDAGLYTCTASNELGIDESRGRLIVLRTPRFIQSLTPRLVTSVGRSFDLQCDATTEEMLDIAYIWTHNGLTIRDIDIKNSNNRIVSRRFINSYFS